MTVLVKQWKQQHMQPHSMSDGEYPMITFGKSDYYVSVLWDNLQTNQKSLTPSVNIKVLSKGLVQSALKSLALNDSQLLSLVLAEYLELREQ